MRCLIDADIILYSCGFSAEKPIWRVVVGDKILASFRYKKELDEFVKSTGIVEYEAVKDAEVGPVAHALGNAKDLIRRILLRTGADEYQLYLTGKDNFREGIATILPYKGNRDSTHKPHHFDSLKRYLIENWEAIVVDGMEADDALSIDQVSTSAETCIASIDKDLNGVIGWHFNWNTDELYYTEEEEATRWFYTQLLMGDPTDNIQGIPGIGKIKAAKALSKCDTEEDMYWVALDLYQHYYSTLGYKPMDALIENARLLYMLREEGKMWEPPY